MDFLTDVRTENNNNTRIHMILDGAGYHRAKVVKKYAKPLNIELHYLPRFSPQFIKERNKL